MFHDHHISCNGQSGLPCRVSLVGYFVGIVPLGNRPREGIDPSRAEKVDAKVKPQVDPRDDSTRKPAWNATSTTNSALEAKHKSLDQSTPCTVDLSF